MVYRIFVFLILLLLLPDLYIYRRITKLRSIHRHWLKWVHWLPSLLLVVALLYMLTGDNFTPRRVSFTGTYMIAFLSIVVPKCLYVIFSLLGRLVSCLGFIPFMSPMQKWPVAKAFDVTGLLMAFVGMYIILYGSIFGWRMFQVKEVEFVHPQLPASFDGYRIVQISDFHLGTIAHYPEDIRRVVDIINAQEADMVAVTGDLVNNEATELNGLEPILSAIHARDGVFSVLGNHDYGTYRRWPDREAQRENLEALKQREIALGWRLLLNENEIVKRGSDSIAVVGVENDGTPPFPSLGDLPEATRGTEGIFKILLSHDPTHWRRRVLPETDIHLTLSGHTHAMQFRLGDFSPSAWFYPEWGGLYTDEGRGLYVNSGIGSVMIPYRFGAWPEITVITLRQK